MSIKVGASKPNDKSVFLRKALTNSTGNDFKFNFPNPEKDHLEDFQPQENSTLEIESTIIKIPSNNIFTKSDNSFRFDFSTDTEAGVSGS